MDTNTLKGTTTIGLTCSDGVILIADKRASWGTFVASKQARKIFDINGMVGATVAGSVGDAESLMRLMQAEASLYEVNNHERMTTNAVATLMANILQGNKIFPYLVQVLVGGFDVKAGLYTLDPIGGLIEEKYASTGSGSPMAYGVLEHEYSESGSIDENMPVALKALKSALARDTATGDGIDLAVITKNGFKRYSERDIKAMSENTKKK